MFIAEILNRNLFFKLKVFPEWNIWQDFHVLEYLRALGVDSVPTSQPITTYVQTPSEIASVYSTISYSKSASVLLMWQQALGEEVFRRGLQTFLKHK